MRLRMWTYDLAREQSPTLDHLRQIARLSLDSGYNALGLYLEHRFAYPSTPWSHGIGAMTQEMARDLIAEFPDLQIVPFVNLLGHFEGTLYTEHGKRYREALFSGLQACPTCPEFVDLCNSILDDVLDIFPSELIHLGGDETAQLGQCPRCAERVAKWENEGVADGKARLYAEHFGPLLEKVKESGKRPALWADMFAEHPSALDAIPKETLLFDWQYFNGVKESARELQLKGFGVVACPTLQTYNAAWFHLNESEANVRQHIDEAKAMGLEGLCITTWEMGLFGAYDTLFPAIRAAGMQLDGKGVDFADAYEMGLAGEWAQLLGVELAKCGATFAHSQTRSSLKVRFLLHGNPFLAWMHSGEELSGPNGDRALEIVESALPAAPNEAYQGVTLFVRHAIEFVRMAERARVHYAEGDFEKAIGVLSVTRGQFDELERVAKRTHTRIGGSLADVERCRAAKRHVETVIQRIRQFDDGSLGYLPAFEHITHQKFMPHDQGAWWLINRWGDS